MNANEKELREALESLLDLITSGRHYETQNPYTRPEVKAALQALAYQDLGRNQGAAK